MTTLDPEALCHELEKRGLDWADKDAAFYAYDETKKDVLAECKALVNDPKASDVAKETEARRMPKWKEHQQKMAAAKHAVNIAKIRYATWQAYVELIRSREATQRAEINLR